MKIGAKFLLGENNFLRLCKFHEDYKKSGTSRKILDVDIKEVGIFSKYFKVHKFICKGTSFLWHQMRYMMAILKAIGREDFEPEIIKTILDIENNIDFKLTMEDPQGLILWDCEYKDLKFRKPEPIEIQFISDFFSFWYESTFLKFSILDSMKKHFEEDINGKEELILERQEVDKGISLKKLKK